VADSVCVFARMEEGAPELWVLQHDLWEGGEGGDSNAHGARHSDARFLRGACQNGRRAIQVSRNGGLIGLLRTLR
jgi:hypothetical protein